MPPHCNRPVSSTPRHGNGGGVWQSGRAPVVDGSGAVYWITGNGDWNAATPVSQTISVAQKALTGSITANNKIYDGAMSATIATRTLAGVINADVVSLNETLGYLESVAG